MIDNYQLSQDHNRLAMAEMEANKPIFKGKSKYKSITIKGNNLHLIIKRFLRKYTYYESPTWIAEIETYNQLITIKRKIFGGAIYETYPTRPQEWKLFYKKKNVAIVSASCFLVNWYPSTCDKKGCEDKSLGEVDTEEEAKTIVESYLYL